MTDWLKAVLELTKFRIAILATVSSAAGFIAAAGELSARVLTTSAGTLLIALGTLAFNQFQERDVDALMPRTQNRPIPSGRMSAAAALAVSLGLLVAGSLVLLYGAGDVPMVLGWSALLWYNGVYTPLKRITPFAVMPGALVGAIPPAIGYVAGGGSLADPAIMAIALFFFVWQVPHFWLLLFKYGTQYEKAHLASLTTVFSTDQLARLTFVWIAATAVISMLLPAFGVMYSVVLVAVLVAGAAWLLWISSRMLRTPREEGVFRMAFGAINAFALLVMILMSVDSLVAGGGQEVTTGLSSREPWSGGR